jgi:hypothetical protein
LLHNNLSLLHKYLTQASYFNIIFVPFGEITIRGIFMANSFAFTGSLRIEGFESNGIQLNSNESVPHEISVILERYYNIVQENNLLSFKSINDESFCFPCAGLCFDIDDLVRRKAAIQAPKRSDVPAVSLNRYDAISTELDRLCNIENGWSVDSENKTAQLYCRNLKQQQDIQSYLTKENIVNVELVDTKDERDFLIRISDLNAQLLKALVIVRNMPIAGPSGSSANSSMKDPSAGCLATICCCLPRFTWCRASVAMVFTAIVAGAVMRPELLENYIQTEPFKEYMDYIDMERLSNITNAVNVTAMTESIGHFFKR